MLIPVFLMQNNMEGAREEDENTTEQQVVVDNALASIVNNAVNDQDNPSPTLGSASGVSSAPVAFPSALPAVPNSLFASEGLSTRYGRVVRCLRDFMMMLKIPWRF